MDYGYIKQTSCHVVHAIKNVTKVHFKVYLTRPEGENNNESLLRVTVQLAQCSAAVRDWGTEAELRFCDNKRSNEQQ